MKLSGTRVGDRFNLDLQDRSIKELRDLHLTVAELTPRKLCSTSPARVQRSLRIALVSGMASLFAISACGNHESELPRFGGACTTEAVPGILLSFRDSITDAAYSGPAHVKVFADTLVAEVRIDSIQVIRDTARIGLVPEMAGLYRVSVDAPGFALWQADQVQVIGGECHVQTIRLISRLRKLHTESL